MKAVKLMTVFVAIVQLAYADDITAICCSGGDAASSSECANVDCNSDSLLSNRTNMEGLSDVPDNSTNITNGNPCNFND